MKVNGQLKNAQLEIVTGDQAPGTKAKIQYNTECEAATVDTGSEVHRLQDNRDMPIGSILMWPTEVLPSPHWLLAMGQTLNVADYPELYAVLGGRYGEDTVAETFNVPDYRGQFIRGTDRESVKDSASFANANARIPRADGANLVPGTTQLEGINNHSHSIELRVPVLFNRADVDFNNPDNDVIESIVQEDRFFSTQSSVGSNDSSQLNGFETRPCNIAIDFLIKVK